MIVIRRESTMTQILAEAPALTANINEGWRFSVPKQRSNRNPLDAAEPKVTITKAGLICLNDAALELIGNPSLVLIGFHKEFELIGIIPADADRDTGPGTKEALKYKVAKKTPKDSYITLNTTSFLKDIGFPTGELHIFTPELEKGRILLEIDLIKKKEETQPLTTTSNA
jgi:hypothetical protein